MNIKWNNHFGCPNHTFITSTIMHILEAPKRHYKWNKEKGNPKNKKKQQYFMERWTYIFAFDKAKKINENKSTHQGP